MAYLVTPGSVADLELKVHDVAGDLTDVYQVTWAVYDRENAAVSGATGEAEWESAGTYLAFWTVPAGATVGHRYKVVFTVTVTPGGRSELVPYTLEIAGVVA